MQQVLYIDDEPDILELAEIYFADHKISIKTAQNAQEALDLYVQTPFDVIISDARMPGVKGAELYQELVDKFHFKGHFIIVSGHFDGNEQKTLPKGIALVLMKPIDFDDLIERVRSYLNLSK
jgi:YesN/AraC family two-component response regulator